MKNMEKHATKQNEWSPLEAGSEYSKSITALLFVFLAHLHKPHDETVHVW